MLQVIDGTNYSTSETSVSHKMLSDFGLLKRRTELHD